VETAQLLAKHLQFISKLHQRRTVLICISKPIYMILCVCKDISSSLTSNTIQLVCLFSLLCIFRLRTRQLSWRKRPLCQTNLPRSRVLTSAQRLYCTFSNKFYSSNHATRKKPQNSTRQMAKMFVPKLYEPRARKKTSNRESLKMS